MVNRLLKPSKSNSYFIFGARGTGKSTFIKDQLLKNNSKPSIVINLLNPSEEDLYRTDPEELYRQGSGNKKYDWIVIDEVQKVPKLLDVVHRLIEDHKQKFILSGSSARKLKRGGANLLAGRAFVYHLHPFTSVELGESFDLNLALHWGLLPKLWSLPEIEPNIEPNTENDAETKKEFLKSYVLTYLKEEIQVEQIIRNLDPFRHFLEVAAQMNGKIVNFSKIARDVGTQTVTVQNYYSILEDTLIGFFLPSFHKSVRKRQLQAPRFYFFDPGVVRALSRSLDIPVVAKTNTYGDLFEHFLILEIKKLADYYRKDWLFSYLRTKDDVEIDLIIDRPQEPLCCIEIKSSNSVRPQDINQFAKITSDMKEVRAYCFSNDPRPKQIFNIECLPWRDGIKLLFDG